MPLQHLWSGLLGRQIELKVYEDNMSTIEILRKGFSSKLGHLSRTHRISLAWTAEAIAQEFVTLLHCPTAEQKGDLFTKALDKVKHYQALDSIGMKTALVAALRRVPSINDDECLPLPFYAYEESCQLIEEVGACASQISICLLYTSPSPRD